MRNVVIFSIDQVNDPEVYYRFLRWASQSRALQNVDSSLRLSIGMWQGKLEHSFVVSKEFFMEIPSEFWQHQEAILHVTDSGGAMLYFPGVLEENAWVPIGYMKKTDASDAYSGDAFTYLPDADEYWVVDTR